jgi:hypothetical protein
MLFHLVRCLRPVLPVGTLGCRVQTAFQIALGNFAFPVLINIAELIMMYHDPNFALHNIAVAMVNTYITIIGVTFATLWSAHARYTGKYDRRGEEVARNPEDTDIESRDEHGSIIDIAQHPNIARPGESKEKNSRNEKPERRKDSQDNPGFINIELFWSVHLFRRIKFVSDHRLTSADSSIVFVSVSCAMSRHLVFTNDYCRSASSP